MRNRTYVLVVVVVTAQLAACSRRETPSPVTTPKSPPTTEHATDQSPLIVSVAASATEVMESLCDQFAKKNGIETKINPGPSSGLAAQILNGAPANVFLSANEQWADEVNRAGRVEAMHPLLTNRLVMVVPMSNPGGVTHPEDLLSEKVSKIALAGEKVPAGIYAEQALENLDLITFPKSKVTTRIVCVHFQDNFRRY